MKIGCQSAMSLTNADFRSLLNSADKAVLMPTQSQASKKRFKSTPQDDLKKEKRKQKYLHIQKTQNNKDEKVSEEKGYKDRASERRKCKDEFYQQIAEEFSEMKHRSITESKFLGGDVEHTHLVKGLDFALLAKIRGELEMKGQDKKLQEEHENRITKSNKLTISTLLGRRIFRELYQELHPHNVSFSYRLAKLEAYFLRSGGLKIRENSNEFGKWERMTYVFNLDDNHDVSEIPIMQLKSKFSATLGNNSSKLNGTDSDSSYQYFVPFIHDSILNELEKISEWHIQNRKKKMGERCAKRTDDEICSTIMDNNANNQQQSNSEQANTTVDIFDNAGSLDLTEMLDEVGKKKEKMGKVSRDFSNVNVDLEKSNPIIKKDIIRDEEKMDVEEDEITTNDVNLGVLPSVSKDTTSDTMWNYQSQPNIYPHVVPLVDGNHALCGIDMYTFDTQMPNVPNFYFQKSRIDTKATPYVSTEPPKLIKSGTTTIDQDKGFYSVFKRDDTAFRKRGGEDEREKDPTFVSDTYMECYPGFGEDLSFELYDSDEEDKSKMDMGRQKQYGAKHKHQFKSKNEWERYQLGKEALPKAAFQYGRKMDDNRVTRRRKKLNPEEEWKKIEKMIGDNKTREFDEI